MHLQCLLILKQKWKNKKKWERILKLARNGSQNKKLQNQPNQKNLNSQESTKQNSLANYQQASKIIHSKPKLVLVKVAIHTASGRIRV